MYKYKKVNVRYVIYLMQIYNDNIWILNEPTIIWKDIRFLGERPIETMDESKKKL